MEYWEREEIKALEKEFLQALKEKKPNFDKAKCLLDRGVDINSVDNYGESIINDLLLNLSSYPPECDYCEDDNCLTCEHKRRLHMNPIIDFFIENGWDTVEHGISCIASLVHTTHDARMFYAAKRILECPLSSDPERYEEALESIGIEESYQRCCEECHEQENLYYAMYEAVEAKMNGEPFEGIHPFYRAIGKRIDKVIYFADKLDFVETARGTEFGCDFGLLCGEELVVIRSCVNVLLMNDRIQEKPQIDASSSLGDGVVGATILDISFEHNKITKGKTDYGQPVIILTLDSGMEIRFTHDFGEEEDCEPQARFLSTETNKRITEKRNHLFGLCAKTDIDLDKIEAYIIGAKLDEEDITKTAIRLVDEYSCEVDSFKSANDREPEERELVSSNWLRLFELFLNHGLDPNAVYAREGITCGNLLWELTRIDNLYMIYKLFRFLLQNGADPNVRIDHEGMFNEIDGDIVMDATLMEIEGEDHDPYEKMFRLWLLLMSYGGERDAGGTILDIKEGYSVDMFENCESFSFRKEVTEDDWFLHIYITKTGEEVAVL